MEFATKFEWRSFFRKILFILDKQTNKEIGIFLLALTISLVATAINQTWSYDPISWLDHWAYFGMSYYFPDLITRFPNHPATEILPVIFPAALAYRFLPIDTADMLKDIGLLSVTLFSVGSIVSRVFSRSYGLAIMLLMASYPVFSHHIGESYTTGYVITYLSITLYAMFRGIEEFNENKTINIYFVLAGFTYGLCVMSAILSVIYILPIASLTLIIFASKNKVSFSNIRKIIISIAVGISSSYAITYGLSIYIFNGNASFPLAKNIAKIISFSQGGVFSSPPLPIFLRTANWLLLPSLVSLVSTGYSLRLILSKATYINVHRKTILLALLSVGPICFAILAGLNIFLNQWTLQYSYFSQSLPFIFVSLGACLYLLLGGKREKLLVTFSLVTYSLSLITTRFIFNRAPISYIEESINRNFERDQISTLLGRASFWSILLAFLVILILFWAKNMNKSHKKNFSTILVMTIIFISYPISISPKYDCFVCANKRLNEEVLNYASTPVKLRNSTLILTDKLLEMDPHRDTTFWYNLNKDPMGALILQANGIHNLFKRVNQNLPSLKNKPLGYGQSLPGIPSTGNIIILSSDPMAAKQGVKELIENNVKANLVNSNKLLYGENSYLYLSMVKITTIR